MEKHFIHHVPVDRRDDEVGCDGVLSEVLIAQVAKTCHHLVLAPETFHPDFHNDGKLKSFNLRWSTVHWVTCTLPGSPPASMLLARVTSLLHTSYLIMT